MPILLLLKVCFIAALKLSRKKCNKKESHQLRIASNNKTNNIYKMYDIYLYMTRVITMMSQPNCIEVLLFCCFVVVFVNVVVVALLVVTDHIILSCGQ